MTEFENRSWKEIDQDRFGPKGKSKHHNISIEKLSEAAQKRLREKGYTDINDIYSLRLEGKLRIFGFRKQNYLDILWVDPEHEVCPVSKD